MHEIGTESVVLVGHITRKRGRSVELREGQTREKRKPRPLKVARMLALAHVFQRMIQAGVMADQTELARLTGFSNARITQLMNLTLLAPSIQEEILGMTVESGRDRVTERSLRRVVGLVEWEEQEVVWKSIAGRGERQWLTKAPIGHLTARQASPLRGANQWEARQYGNWPLPLLLK